MANIRATPWSLRVPEDTEVVFKEKRDVENSDIQGKIIVARQPYLKASDFARYGLTRGCPKCDQEIS